MARVANGRRELEVYAQGEGEPVLTIHGAFTPYAFDELCREPLLCHHFRMISYHRHNYGLSTRGGDSYSIQDGADDALQVLRQVGGERGHVVAHSAGAPYALQLVLDHPDAVQSLTLIEPVLPTPELAEFLGQVSGHVGEAFTNGDSDSAATIFLAAIYGSDDFRDHLDPVLPDIWWERCVSDFDYGMTVESPAIGKWSFGPEDGAWIRQPVLLLEGTETIPMWPAIHKHFKQWVPHTEHKIIPGVNHFIQFLKPTETAQAIEPFLKRHSAARAPAASET